MHKISLVALAATFALVACGEQQSTNDTPAAADTAAPTATVSSESAVATNEQESAMITGSVFYRERIALPPDSSLTVQLLDVSRADAPSTLIGEVVYDDIGAPPYNFEISYDASQIDARMRYSLRAEIRNGEKLLFTTTQSYPVFTEADNGEPKLLLQSVGGAQ